MREVYEPTTIPAETYPFQPEAVETVATRAVLLTFEYKPKWNQYHRDSCRAVADVTHLMTTRIDQLRTLGHPKWRSVDLDAEQPGWEVSTCARLGMSEDYQLDCDPAALRAVDDISAAYRTRICRGMGLDC